VNSECSRSKFSKRRGLLCPSFTSIDSPCGGDSQDYRRVLCGVSDMDFDDIVHDSGYLLSRIVLWPVINKVTSP